MNIKKNYRLKKGHNSPCRL